PDRGNIVGGADEFPTDRYVLEGLASARGLEIRRHADKDTALVCRSLVDFRTSALGDVADLVDEAHAVGALAMVDLSHAGGIVPVDLDGSGVDLAVGCTYKWLCAGPGAPAYLYVRRDLQESMRQPIWGWFGQRDMFAMGPAYDPEPDIRRFLAGTPSILALAAVDAAAGLTGMTAVREASLALTAAFIDGVGAAAEVVTPEQRGGHVAVRHPEAAAVSQRLAAAGLVTDTRADLIRFGFHPLTSSLDDVAKAVCRCQVAFSGN
ncbi:MAG: aminotransferase class V-fold PLP-dependent enzyme, partial [Actinobacteria bacterium]|nr:aminotransferase class V-fold PLP-dependent enzyme [Actinomycetota bacterium]